MRLILTTALALLAVTPAQAVTVCDTGSFMADGHIPMHNKVVRDGDTALFTDLAKNGKQIDHAVLHCKGQNCLGEYFETPLDKQPRFRVFVRLEMDSFVFVAVSADGSATSDRAPYTWTGK